MEICYQDPRKQHPEEATLPVPPDHTRGRASNEMMLRLFCLSPSVKFLTKQGAYLKPYVYIIYTKRNVCIYFLLL